MDKLKLLLNRCKCAVYITVNEHRNYYVTVADHLKDLRKNIDVEILPEVETKMIETDTIIDIHFYINTPIVFGRVCHYDLDMAIDEALDMIK